MMILARRLLFPAVLIISGAANFAQTAILTRALHPESYAAFGLALVAAGTLNALFLEWLRQSALRYLSSDTDLRLILRLAALLREYGTVGLTCLLCSLLYSLLFPGLSFIVIVLLFVVEGAFNLLVSLARSRELHGQFLVLLAGRSLLSVALVAVLMRLHPSGGAAILGVLLSFIISIAIGLGVARRRLSGRRLMRVSARAAFRRKAFRGTHIQLGKGLLLAGFISYVSGFGDRVLLAVVADAYLAGQYFAAMDVVGKAVTLASQCLNLMLFVPFANRIDNHCVDKVLAIRTYFLSFLIFYAVIAVMFYVTSWIIPGYFLGEAYRVFFREWSMAIVVVAISRSFVQYAVCGMLQLVKEGSGVFWVTSTYAISAGSSIALALVVLHAEPVAAMAGATATAAVASGLLALRIVRRSCLLRAQSGMAG